MKTLVTITLAILLVASTATAQDLQRGVDLRAAGDDAGALVEFHAAYDATRSPVALAQMGLAEQALGLWADAEEHVRLALAVVGNAWVDRHRDALTTAYAVIVAHVPVARTPVQVSLNAGHDRSGTIAPVSRTLPLAVGAGAVVLLGLGFAGWAMRESIVQEYNARCRGFGDPNPATGCGQAEAAASASGATGLAVTGFVTGGLVAIVAAVLFTRGSERSRIACGAGPGDVGISCGGAL